MSDDLTNYIGNAQEFPVLRHWDFFNHAGASPLPRVVAEAMRKYVDETSNTAYLTGNRYAKLDNIRAVAIESYAFVEDDPGEQLLKDQIILELKYRFDLPPLFKELIEAFNLTSNSVSKYRLGAATLGLVTPAASAPEPDSQVAVA